MAINQGFGPHFAWIAMSGGVFPLEHGSVQQNAQRQSSTFSGALPMNYPGAYEAFSSPGASNATITVSTRGIEGVLIVGELLTISFDYVPGIIRFAGHDMSDKLHQSKSNEQWQNKTGTEIAQELAGRAGLGFAGGGGGGGGLMAGKQAYQDFVKLTDNMSYAGVIHKLAEYDGMRWWVSPQGILNYFPIGVSLGGSYSLNVQLGQPMHADFLKLEVTQNIPANGNIQVTVKSWHPKQKQVFTGTSNVTGKGSGQMQYKYDIPGLIQNQVQQHAKSRAEEAASHAYKLVAEVVGDPSIDPSMSVSLSGTGAFDGSYQIETITHEIGMSGHRMTIQAKMGNTAA